MDILDEKMSKLSDIEFLTNLNARLQKSRNEWESRSDEFEELKNLVAEKQNANNRNN